MLQVDVLIANPSSPPCLATFPASGASLKVGNFKEAALCTDKPSDPLSEKPVNKSDDAQKVCMVRAAPTPWAFVIMIDL